MSTATNKQTIKKIRTALNRLSNRLIVLRMQRKLFRIAGDASIYAFSRLATYSLSVQIFWLKRFLLRTSCKLHPITCWILQKSKDLITLQQDAQDRVQILMNALDCLENMKKCND